MDTLVIVSDDGNVWHVDRAENGDAEKINNIRVSGCDDGDYVEDRRSLYERCDYTSSSADVIESICRKPFMGLYGVEWTEIKRQTVNRWVTLPLPPFIHCWVVSFGWC